MTPPNFMKYPHPDVERVLTRLETFPGVKEETKECVARLLDYRAVRTRARFPRGQSTAVLVPLFVGRSGDLYVLLSRRSDALKTFAGDTALPGGKFDEQDTTVVDTARREAFEEVGLPRDEERAPLLCVMEPHLAKGEILVTPVVVLILDYGLQPNLNSSEVTSIFAQPLISFLSSTPPRSLGGDTTDYHTFTDLPWSDGGAIRLHKFLTGREREGVKPVFGLTASILIKTATVGYGRQPEFEVQPPNAPTSAQQIAYALRTPSNPIRIACEREGIDVEKTVARILRPSVAANSARTIEWEKIGLKWERLLGGGLNAGEVSPTRNDDVAVDREKRQERGKEQGDAVPDMAKLDQFLDQIRDMVNERMKEVMGDEKKLAKARKVYTEVMKQVKKQLEGALDENGEFDPKALFAMIPKEYREDDIEAGEKGIEKGKDHVEYGEGKGGKEGTRNRLEEMKKYIGKGGDGDNTEQTSQKRGVKL